MTNDELVKRLRDLSPQLSMFDCEDVLQAVDRIKALEVELAEFRVSAASLLIMLDELVQESGRQVEYGHEDSFRMGEWFEKEELEEIERVRSLVKAAQEQPK